MLRAHTKITLGELCEFINGNGFRPPDWSDTGLPIIRIQNLNGSREFNYFSGKPRESWIVKPGDILFAWAGVRGVSFGPTVWSGPTGVLNQHIFRVVPRLKVDRYWLFAALKFVTARIEARAHGFKSSLLHVQRGEIVDQVIDVPTLDEQQQIAAVLQLWDGAIETTERLSTLIQRRMRAFQQQLLSVGDPNNASWKELPLSEIADRVRRKNDGGDYPIMTISGKSGFLRQDEKFSRFMAGESLDNYTLLRAGEFSYNKGNSKTYPQGCIYRLSQDTALVPHVYISFKLHEGLSASFYAALFQAGFLNRQLARIVNSGVRNNGLLNVNIEDFFACKVPVPPPDMQTKIAELFEVARRESAVVEMKLENLHRERRALMQRLFTGKSRLAGLDLVTKLASSQHEEAFQ